MQNRLAVVASAHDLRACNVARWVVGIKTRDAYDEISDPDLVGVFAV